MQKAIYWWRGQLYIMIFDEFLIKVEVRKTINLGFHIRFKNVHR